MKKIKQLSILFILLMLIMGVCGCMSEKKSNKAEEMKNIALEYLNENYDDNFTALGYSDGDWAYDYSTVNFSSEKYTGMVEVRIYEENETYTFRDDYFKLTMEAGAKEYFEALVSKYGYAVEIKVRFISSVLPDGLSASSSFADYIASYKCNMDIYFISNSAFTESDIDSLLTELCNAKIMGIFTFIVTNDSELLSQYSISEFLKEKSEWILEEQSYSINRNFEVIE